MLNDIVILLFLSVFNSFFVYFIDFCFNEGNIFDKYYSWIYEKYKDNNTNMFKVLGGCIYCFGTWIYIGNFILFNLYYSLPFIFIFLGIGINYISLRILDKYIE